MKKSKISIILSLALILICSACGAYALTGETDTNKEVVTVNRAGLDDELLIGSWVTYTDYNLISHEDQMKRIADAGVNFNLYPFAWYDSDSYDSLEDWQEIDALCEKYKIHYSISAMSKDSNNEVSYQKIKEWFPQLSDYCFMTNLYDEPVPSALPGVGDWAKKYAANVPGLQPFTNLLPDGAQPGATYEEYMQGMVDSLGSENVAFVSHDMYPFTTGGNNYNIFSQMEIMRRVAYDSGKLKTHSFIQSTAWNGARLTTPEEIRWETYAYLTYGFKAFSYFNYLQPGEIGESSSWGSSLILRDGTIPDQERFDAVSDINWELRSVGKELVKLDAAHTYHTSSKYQNVEYLPDNFMIQPMKADDDFIISYMTPKNASEKPALMIFNNSIDSGKTAQFSVDEFSGIEGMEYFNPATEQYEKVNISDGKITLDFTQGEAKLIRLSGDVSIKEPLKSPKIELLGGSYNYGQKAVITAEKDSEIYYTTDGSYPTVDSEKYVGPILLGSGDCSEKIVLRAAAVRGKEKSLVVSETYYISPSSYNVALNCDAYVTKDVKPYKNWSNYSAEILTDGSTKKAVATENGQHAFAVVDLGKEQQVKKIIFNGYNNQNITALRIEISNDKTFRQGVTTVFNSDANNLFGLGVGEDSSSDYSIDFSTVSGRYVRAISNEDGRSIYSEIQVFCDENYSVNQKPLVIDESFVAAGGTWNYENGVLSQSTVASASANYVKNDEKYSNVILSGDFSISKDGNYVGFGFRKAKPSSTGIIVGVKPSGVAYYVNGTAKVTGEITATNFDKSSFNLKVAVVGNSIEVKVNGERILYVNDSSVRISEGYVSVFSGNNIMSVTNLNIETVADNFVIKENIASASNLPKIIIDKYVILANVIKMLPETMTVKGENGTDYKVAVSWNSEDYDRNKFGSYLFVGTLDTESQGLLNVNNITARVVVFVKETIDNSNLKIAIDRFKTLVKEDYTLTSWANAVNYYEAALNIYNSTTVLQEQYDVAENQLILAMNLLAINNANKNALVEAINEAKAQNLNGCLALSKKNFQLIIAAAEKCNNNTLSTQSEIDGMVLKLKAAQNDLRFSVDKTSLSNLIKEAESKMNGNFTLETLSQLRKAIDFVKIYLAMDIDSVQQECLTIYLNSKINGLIEIL